MGFAFAMAVVQGADVDADAVRRALWLPRKPDARHAIEALTTRPLRERCVGIRAREGWVEAFGVPLIERRRPWEDLSRAGARVFVFFLAENFEGNVWAIYEEGRRVRWFSEPERTDEGERHALEPAPDPEEHPVERISDICQAMTGEDPTHDLDFEAEVDAWVVGAGSDAR